MEGAVFSSVSEMSHIWCRAHHAYWDVEEINGVIS